VIGLQARLNPSARRAAELIAAGAIGRPLNARIVSTTVGGGPNTLSAYDYFNKTESGANILTIAGGHTLDLIETVLGEIVNVDARAEVLWPTVSVLDTGGTSKRETPDHVDVLGRTASGAIFVADIVSGAPMDEPRFEFEIRGSEGWLKLTGGHPYGFQAGDLTLTASVEFESPDRPVVEGGLMGAAINVGEVYARLLSDLRDGTHSAPDFALALHNSRLTDAVAHASKSGQRQAVPK
jgi:predicted dehydrogenase